MFRPWTALALAMLAALAWLMPHPDRARAGAWAAAELLQRSTGVEGPSLARQLLDTAAVLPTGPAGGAAATTFRIAGVRMTSRESSGDPTVHSVARRSIVRGLRAEAARAGTALTIEGELAPENGGVHFLVNADGELSIEAALPDGTKLSSSSPWSPPRKSALAPALVAVALALLLRAPLVGVLAGIATAVALLARVHQAEFVAEAARFLGDVPRSAKELALPLCAAILVVVLAVTQRNGGLRGLGDLVSSLFGRAARTPRGAQIAVWLGGVAVFADPHAKLPLVGGVLRPVTDRAGVSREKLAYLLDATAVAIGGLCFASTWLALALVALSPEIPAAGFESNSALDLYVRTLPWRSFSILTLVWSALIAFTGRDFGPMRAAESRARAGGALWADGSHPLLPAELTSAGRSSRANANALRGALPWIVFFAVVLALLWRNASAAGSLAAAPSAMAKAWALACAPRAGEAYLLAALAALAVAALSTLAMGLASELPRALSLGLQASQKPLVLLALAWLLARAIADLRVPELIAASIGPRIAPELLPALLFALAAAVSFAMQSSLGALALLLPSSVALSAQLGEGFDIGGPALALMSVPAVLEGALCGAQLSVYASTTVLSATGGACDLADHVRTQVPYVLVTAAVAWSLGFLAPGLFRLSPWLALALGAATLSLLLWRLGRRCASPPTSPVQAR